MVLSHHARLFPCPLLLLAAVVVVAGSSMAAAAARGSSPARLSARTRAQPGGDVLTAEVCVVGAGAAGAQLYRDLALDGVDVLLLEKDPRGGGGRWETRPVSGVMRSEYHADVKGATVAASERRDMVSLLPPMETAASRSATAFSLLPPQSTSGDTKQTLMPRRGKIQSRDYAIYVRDFLDVVQNKNPRSGDVIYGVTVKYVRPQHESDDGENENDNHGDTDNKNDPAPQAFLLHLEYVTAGSASSLPPRALCETLVWAAGLHKPHVPPAAQALAGPGERVVHYADLPEDYATAFAGEKVLVVGSGESAMETAAALWEHAASVDVIAGSGGLRLAVENGNPDGVSLASATILDKAIVPGFEASPLQFHRVGCARDGWKLTVDAVDTSSKISHNDMKRDTGVRYRCMKRDHGWRPSAYQAEDHERFEVLTHRVLEDPSVLEKSRPGKKVSKRRANAESYAAAAGTLADGVYDRIVLCTGFAMDQAPFEGAKRAFRPDMDARTVGALPRLRSNYESWNVPGLFFAGALAHSRDHIRGAGGTLRGMRYTARALRRVLVARRGGLHDVMGGAAGAVTQDVRHHLAWPDAVVTGTREATLAHLRGRLRNATGIFHMHEELCDVASADSAEGRWSVFPEVPLDFIPRLLNFGAKRKAQRENTAAGGGSYKRFITLCFGKGQGYYAMSDAFPMRWRGDFEGHRPHAIQKATKQKDLELARGGTTGTGVDVDKLHPVLGYYDMKNVLGFREMKHGGPDRMGAIGYGISHASAPMASLHLLDDPSFRFAMHFSHTRPLQRWFDIYGKAVESAKGWTYGNKMAKRAKKEGGLKLPKFKPGKSEVHVECYAFDYEPRRIIARTEKTGTLQHVIPVPPSYNGGLLRVPQTSLSRKLFLNPLTLSPQSQGKGGGQRTLGDGQAPTQAGYGMGDMGGMGSMGGMGGMGGGMPDPSQMSPEQRRMYEQYMSGKNAV